MVKRSLLFGALYLSLILFSTPVLRAYEGWILERSMKGSDVAGIQRVLNSLGYGLKVDGKFGPKTEGAVRCFQQNSGIAVDGILGPRTLTAIYAAGRRQIHQVRRGDSLSKLAVIYGSTVADLKEANALSDERIFIGQRLLIPPPISRSGRQNTNTGRGRISMDESKETMRIYKVQPGDCSYVIAKRFNTTISALLAVNNLPDPSRLQAGQELLIPAGGVRLIKERLCWPVHGRISSPYGWREHPIYKRRQFHGGIDIAVPIGTNIQAAASGRVIKAENMGGFGLGVVLDHGHGVTTWYGHNSKLLVKVGERVVRGQLIAQSGSTGVSTGPHLDFRIKVNGNTVNPAHWLD
jgi:murein DD-endopeptidase MepM/ murein hydrolase activator NlpD